MALHFTTGWTWVLMRLATQRWLQLSVTTGTSTAAITALATVTCDRHATRPYSRRVCLDGRDGVVLILRSTVLR